MYHYDDERDDYYDSRGDSEPDTPKGYCEACGEYVTSIAIDEGIGFYEYWGCKGFDSQIFFVSPCCEADLLDKDPSENEEEE
jgi:hypothetical protein